MDNCGEIYRYAAFGLEISSAIMMPELNEGVGSSVDVRIRCADVPLAIHSPLEIEEDYQIGENEFLLHVEGVASFYVKNGDQIIVQLCSQYDLCEVRLYLLGTAMGVLLMQRGVLPIHGSAVVVEGRCIIFAGISGAGKSTLAAALRKNGYALLADDISAVIFDDNGLPWVQPGYPQQKLWQTSAALLSIDTTTLRKVSPDIEKYAVPVLDNFWQQAIPLTAIYEIDVKPCDDITIKELKGMEKLTTIMDNAYRASLYPGLGLQTLHFQKSANIVNQVQVFRLTRPEGVCLLDRQLSILVRHFTNCIKKHKRCIQTRKLRGGL